METMKPNLTFFLSLCMCAIFRNPDIAIEIFRHEVAAEDFVVGGSAVEEKSG